MGNGRHLNKCVDTRGCKGNPALPLSLSLGSSICLSFTLTSTLNSPVNTFLPHSPPLWRRQDMPLDRTRSRCTLSCQCRISLFFCFRPLVSLPRSLSPGPDKWPRTACTRCTSPLRWDTASGRVPHGNAG